METAVKLAATLMGTSLTFLFGGWTPTLSALIVFVIADYITGILAAGAQGQLSRKVGFIGISRKVYMFLIVALAHLADNVLGSSMIMAATIYFYLANELLSILENGGRLGVPIPPVIRQAVDALKGKGGSGQK